MQFDTPEKVMKHLENTYKKHNFYWRKKGKYHVGFCPNHEDKKTPNLYILPNAGNNGYGYHWYCFTCGFWGPKLSNPFEQALRQLKDFLIQEKPTYLYKRLSDIDIDYLANNYDVGFFSMKYYSFLFGEFKDKIRESKINDFYDDKLAWLVFGYRDVTGKLVRLKFREIISNEKRIKTITLVDDKELQPHFFNYKALFSGDKVLFVTEGEFDALSVELYTDRYSALAVGGTSGFSAKNITEILKKAKDKIVFVQSDWDTAGQQAVLKLTEELNAKSLKKLYYVLTPFEINAKDLDEYIKLSNNPETDIDNLLDKINVVCLYDLKQTKQKEEEKQLEAQISKYPQFVKEILLPEKKQQLKIVKTFENDDVPEPPRIVCDTFPQGYISMLAAPSGTGKTYAAIHFVLKYVEETQKNVCLWLSEDVEQTKFRVYQMLNKTSWEQKKDLLKDKIYHIESLPEAIVTNNNNKYNVNDSFFDVLKQVVERFDFIVLDPITNFFASNENDNVAARFFMNTLLKLVFKTNKVILLVHHTNKNNTNINDKDDIEIIKEAFKEKIRGASAFVDAARSVLYLLHHREPIAERKAVKAVVIKSNVVVTGKTELIQLPFAYENSKFNKFKDSFVLVR